MNWNFYFSGILYAKIREETEALTVRLSLIHISEPTRP